MDNLRTLLENDIDAAVNEKLAGIDKSAGTHRKKNSIIKKYKLEDIAAKSSQYAAGAVMASIIKDIHERPVEFIKNKIYSIIDSAAGKILK